VIALSATATSTSTPLATATSTPTIPPTKTPTLAATRTYTKVPSITPNLTRTAFTDRLDKTATALAKVSDTPVPSATSDSGTDNSGDSGSAEAAIAELVKSGVLDSDAGGVVASADKVDLVVENEDESSWDEIEKPVDVFDFVASTDVSWDSPDEHMECGFAFRYSPATDDNKNWTFYIVTLYKNGSVKGWVRDESGYRNDPIFDQKSDVINTENREVNHLVVIGQEDTFRIFVNGHYIGKFSEDTYKSGRVEVFGSRFKDSQSLVCHFRNAWVWQLER